MGYIIVIVLSVGDGAVVASFIVISVDFIEIETIVLDAGTGAITVAFSIDDEGDDAIESTHLAFSWDRGIITTYVYWLMVCD